MSDEQRLPFKLFDGALDRMKSMVHAGTDMARSGLSGRHETVTATDGEAESVSSFTPEGLDPAATATAAPALATALNAQASEAIAAHVGEKADVTDGLALKDQSGRVAPDEELGPEPFTPQVGP